jgi:uncharacterized protein (DUF1697 family)
MATHVALLRAVNVGGVKVAMADLRELAEGLGWSDVETHLNSGNLLFTTAEDEDGAASRLEGALAELYGREVPVMVRTLGELAAALDRRPFREERYLEKGVQVAFLSGVPAAGALERLGPLDPEECVLDGREAFLYYPNGLGRSKLTNAVLERGLGVRTTVRGLRTVAGLLARS